MKLSDKIKVLIASILLLSYSLPMVISVGETCYCPLNFIDILYAIGTTLGIGAYLIFDSYKLQKMHEYYLISAGVFFIILSCIFIFDSIHDSMFETYWYVVFNILTTITCYLLLIYRKVFIRH